MDLWPRWVKPARPRAVHNESSFMILSWIKSYLRRHGLRPETFNETYPVLRPMDAAGLEILRDPAFQASCREIEGLTLLDTHRLANLWQLVQLARGEGCLIEIGSYRGGSALHLSNACPQRLLYVCDAFSAGFSALEPELDTSFQAHQFSDNRRADVEALFRTRDRKAVIVEGFFPESIRTRNLEPGPIAFAHVDVDVYQATADTLAYLAERMIPRSLIVLDDVRRGAQGVDRAIAEFLVAHPDWTFLPLFPGQGVLIRPA